MAKALHSWLSYVYPDLGNVCDVHQHWADLTLIQSRWLLIRYDFKRKASSNFQKHLPPNYLGYKLYNIPVESTDSGLRISEFESGSATYCVTLIMFLNSSRSQCITVDGNCTNSLGSLWGLNEIMFLKCKEENWLIFLSMVLIITNLLIKKKHIDLYLLLGRESNVMYHWE